MNYHRSNVNFQKLIQDLADMYNYSVPEVVLAELVANSLDAGASQINITYDAIKRILVVEDNGSGMTKDQFNEYHDFAAELKTRGDGIGFAGLGAKISFNVANKVITETRSSTFEGGSKWYLKSSKELGWEDFPRINRHEGYGTRVEVHFNKAGEKPYLNEEEIAYMLIKQYLPLFDKQALSFYSKIKKYPHDLTFYVNGKKMHTFDMENEFSLAKDRRFILQVKGKRYGFGCFGLSPQEYPMGEDAVGIAVCVYGKVVQYEYLKQHPGEVSPRIMGFVEIPPLIKFLNTSKSGFKRQRSTANEFKKYYEPAIEEFRKWLIDIGVKPIEEIDSKEAVKLEQELKKLVDEIPELLQLFGTTIKRDTKQKSMDGDITGTVVDGSTETFPTGEGQKREDDGLVDEGDAQGESIKETPEGEIRAKPISRSRRAGVRISFANEPERIDLAWLEGNIVIINLGHKSYIKVEKDAKARRLHNIFATALCLEKELKEQNLIEPEEPFIERMMSAWGSIK